MSRTKKKGNKGNKESKETVVSPVRRKRRSREDVCAGYRETRRKVQNLLNYRRKIVDGIKDPKRKAKVEKEIQKLTAKRDSLSVKVFKCGKKYSAMLLQRNNLIKNVSRLKRRLLSDHEMTVKERNKILTQIAKENDQIRDLTTLMGLPLVEQKKGVVSFVTNRADRTATETVVIWEVRKKVESLINGGRFEVLEIEGERYALINRLGALWALDDYVAAVTASQRDSRIQTPMMEVSINLVTKLITVRGIF